MTAQKILFGIGVLALAGIVLAACLFYNGSVQELEMKRLILGCTIVWFAAALGAHVLQTRQES